jgi:hypothetical protein
MLKGKPATGATANALMGRTISDSQPTVKAVRGWLLDRMPILSQAQVMFLVSAGPDTRIRAMTALPG